MPVKKYVRPAPRPVDLVQVNAKPVLTLNEASALLGFHPWSVRKLIASGALKTLRIPSTKGTSRTAKVIRIARTDLDLFIASCGAGAKGAV
jgi:hypothetical protein